MCFWWFVPITVHVLRSTSYRLFIAGLLRLLAPRCIHGSACRTDHDPFLSEVVAKYIASRRSGQWRRQLLPLERLLNLVFGCDLPMTDQLPGALAAARPAACSAAGGRRGPPAAAAPAFQALTCHLRSEAHIAGSAPLVSGCRSAPRGAEQ